MVMTAAERKANQRKRARKSGKCENCCKRKARADRTTCGKCAAENTIVQRRLRDGKESEKA